MYLTPHFLPCVEYCAHFLKQDTLDLNIDGIYFKQSYRNRAYILGANKIETLTVPVHASSGKTQIKDVKIDNHSQWQRNIWRTITSAYRKAPFFEHYDYLFQKNFEKKYNFLIDLNVDNMTSCLKSIGTNKTICLVEEGSSEGDFDLNAKKRVNNNAIVAFQEYHQNFGNVFVPNLSIIDMIFCCGPETKLLLDKS